MIGFVAMAATLVAMLSAVGLAVATASRAQGAADACALAAAAEARDLRALRGKPGGPFGDPCATAEAVAGEWGVALEGCSVGAAGAVTVTVGVRSVVGSVSRSARAGT